jgi:GNAT superfamily N-acetyltransferase
VTLFVERLGRQHVRERFRSGRAELDNWFWHNAGQADKRQDSARVWVLCDDEIEQGHRPIGYYALVAHSIVVGDSPAEIVRSQPPGYPVGAVLLARLAVDETFQSRGLGRRLLADAVRRVGLAAEHVAVPLFVVDALDDQAARFYERFGFQRSPTDPLRLLARHKDIHKNVADLVTSSTSGVDEAG